MNEGRFVMAIKNISPQKNEIDVGCDSLRCPLIERVLLDVSFEMEGRIFRYKDGPVEHARKMLEVRGWFTERFPKKDPRDFCPAHAPAYRTMFFKVMGYAAAILFFAFLGACGNIEEVTQPDAGGPIKGRIESDAGPLRIDLGAGGSGAGGAGAGAGAGGSAGSADSGAGGVTGSGGAGAGGSGSGGSVASPDAGAVMYSCDDLANCCSSIQETNLRSQCVKEYQYLVSGNATGSCSDALVQIKASGLCGG